MRNLGHGVALARVNANNMAMAPPSAPIVIKNLR
jgi:hypothetical protein